MSKIDQLLAKQFGDAPRELNATIHLAMNALKENRKGEALYQLQRAHQLVTDKQLEEWKAEMAAAWAVYHYHMGDKRKMKKSIAFAKKREPDNKRLQALLTVLK